MSDSVRFGMYYGLTPVFDRLYSDSKLNHEFVHLMDLICEKENVMLAYRSIKRNDGSVTPGVDGMTIDDLENRSVEEVVNLIRNKFQWYSPKPVRRVEIPKPYDPSKMRPLGIPCLIDRLCQQCIKQILEPIAEAKFYENSFGFRPNRSCKDAIAVFTHHANISKLHFVVDVDIHAFFDCVSHTRLMRQLWKMGIHDRTLLVIIYRMLKAPVIMPDGSRIIPDRGVPQGAVLSPLLANIALNDLDWWIAKQWEYHPEALKSKHPNWNKLRRAGIREVHIVRYADDFKLFCRTRNDAKDLLEEVSEWLGTHLHLETSPEKSGITNIKKSYTEFLGIELKVRNKKAELSSEASNYRRRWIVTSRIKRKAMPKIRLKLHEAVVKLANAPRQNTIEAVDNYNSVVDGIQNYYSMASQVAQDLSTIQKSINLTMYNRVKGLTDVKPETPTSTRKTDVKFVGCKQVRYLIGCMVHPIGFVKFTACNMPNRTICNYTVNGRAPLGVHTGVPEYLLAWMARHTPPGMPIEMADNRISAFSAQKGKCAILQLPIPTEQVITILINPTRKKRPYRYHNILTISPLAFTIVTTPNVLQIAQIISNVKLDKKQLKLVNKLRLNRGLTPI